MMAASKKQSGKATRGAGRPPGSPNKTTVEAREAIGLFIEGNVEKLQKWLDDVAETDPARAFQLFQTIIEYHIPKLGRTEVAGNVSGITVISIDEMDSRI